MSKARCIKTRRGGNQKIHDTKKKPGQLGPLAAGIRYRRHDADHPTVGRKLIGATEAPMGPWEAQTNYSTASQRPTPLQANPTPSRSGFCASFHRAATGIDSTGTGPGTVYCRSV